MIDLRQGDCLELLKDIPDGSVDLILTDLPYGTTVCVWDEIIPLDAMWAEFERVTRPNAYIVLTASQPFTTKLIASNIDNFSHQWVWDKKMSANPLLARKMPMKNFEDIAVFCFNYNHYDERRAYFKRVFEYISKTKSHIIKDTNQGLDHCFRFASMQFDLPVEANYQLLIDTYGIDKMQGFLPYDEIPKHRRVYNPQMEVRGEPVRKGFRGKLSGDSFLGGIEIDTRSFNNTYYPKAIIEFSNRKKDNLHPTQKPVALLEYLIKTYTHEGYTVLDVTMGSGSTGVACVNTNRKFIGIELDKDYFAIAEQRINDTIA